MTHTVTFRKGFIKLVCIVVHEDGTTTETKGGWVDDEQNGRLFGAICSCGEQAVGWSRGSAVDNLGCSKK